MNINSNKNNNLITCISRKNILTKLIIILITLSSFLKCNNNSHFKMWDCDSCSFNNQDISSNCTMCNAGKPKSIIKSKKEITWSCTKCTLINNINNAKCNLCGTERKMIKSNKKDVKSNKIEIFYPQLNNDNESSVEMDLETESESESESDLDDKINKAQDFNKNKSNIESHDFIQIDDNQFKKDINQNNINNQQNDKPSIIQNDFIEINNNIIPGAIIKNKNKLQDSKYIKDDINHNLDCDEEKIQYENDKIPQIILDDDNEYDLNENWNCQICTFENLSTNNKCTMCHNSKEQQNKVVKQNIKINDDNLNNKNIHQNQASIEPNQYFNKKANINVVDNDGLKIFEKLISMGFDDKISLEASKLNPKSCDNAIQYIINKNQKNNDIAPQLVEFNNDNDNQNLKNKWKCKKCSNINDLKSNNCIGCSNPKLVKKELNSFWICSICTLQNKIESIRCAVCSSPINKQKNEIKLIVNKKFNNDIESTESEDDDEYDDEEKQEIEYTDDNSNNKLYSIKSLSELKNNKYNDWSKLKKNKRLNNALNVSPQELKWTCAINTLQRIFKYLDYNNFNYGKLISNSPKFICKKTTQKNLGFMWNVMENIASAISQENVKLQDVGPSPTQLTEYINDLLLYTNHEAEFRRIGNFYQYVMEINDCIKKDIPVIIFLINNSFTNMHYIFPIACHIEKGIAYIDTDSKIYRCSIPNIKECTENTIQATSNAASLFKPCNLGKFNFIKIKKKKI